MPSIFGALHSSFKWDLIYKFDVLKAIACLICSFATERMALIKVAYHPIHLIIRTGLKFLFLTSPWSQCVLALTRNVSVFVRIQILP